VSYARRAIQLNCDGPNHVNIRDTDGTLTGLRSSIMGEFDPNGRQFPYDQGTALIPGPCQYSPIWDAYSCLPNQTTFELAPVMKPNPLPVGGIFGDPQHFVLEVTGRGDIMGQGSFYSVLEVHSPTCSVCLQCTVLLLLAPASPAWLEAC
jgi:hypothetical protein